MYFIDRLEFRKVVQDRLIQWRELRVSRLVDGLDHPVFSRRIESREEPTRWEPTPKQKARPRSAFPSMFIPA